ncbi:MAG: HD domain-containing protein [Lachnospiraceae bacterium]|nr:HD domain-containing protein [Lachnospiraceae bacterium]
MAGKRILTTRALANMITSDDVYTSDDKLVIPAETVITDDIIAALKEYSIFAIRVKVGEDGQTPIMYGETDTSEEADDKIEESISGEKEADNEADEEEPLDEEDEQLNEEDINKIIDILNSSNGQNEVDTIMQLGGLTENHSEESPKDNGYIRTQDTEEFKVFNKVYLDSIDSLKDTFNNVVMKNEEIDKDAILKDVQNVVSKSRNSIHIIDMLQCMRGYNDVTYVHSMNVALLSNMIGRIIYPDIRDEELDVLTLAGLLHDIGKMMIPDEIINKKGRLTESEYNIVKTHVLHGNNILKNLNLDPRIAEVAMRHHERCDGSGYPGGYRREQTEPFARIVAIADTYDAMTSDRVYRPAICPFDVIHMFEREGIIKYDTEYLLPFLEKAVQAYINADVKLTTDEIGRVIMINQNRFSRPVVKVGNEFYDLSEKENAGISIDKVIM